MKLFALVSIFFTLNCLEIEIEKTSNISRPVHISGKKNTERFYTGRIGKNSCCYNIIGEN